MARRTIEYTETDYSAQFADLDRAEHFFREALDIARALNDYHQIAGLFEKLGEISLERHTSRRRRVQVTETSQVALAPSEQLSVQQRIVILPVAIQAIPRSNGRNLLLRFQLEESLTVEILNGVVVPVVRSLQRINSVLLITRGYEGETTTTIQSISYNSPLEISLGGWIPDTINALREWKKERKWRDNHEKEMAELAQAQTEAELRLKELEIRAKQLAYAKELIDVLAPPNLPLEQRFTLAAHVLPELGVLASPQLSFTDDHS